MLASGLLLIIGATVLAEGCRSSILEGSECSALAESLYEDDGLLAGAQVVGVLLLVAGVYDYTWGIRARRCPDCAETVAIEAKVCKHCGYRFEEAI